MDAATLNTSICGMVFHLVTGVVGQMVLVGRQISMCSEWVVIQTAVYFKTPQIA